MSTDHQSLQQKPKLSFTPEQLDIMNSASGHILVSAAAGSGKTHVMTHHVADRIRNRTFDVTQVIVLTFTREAASQMKDRIARVLDEALRTEQSEPDRRYLQAQIDLLPSAKVMTIDAFCLDLVRQFAWDLADSEGELLLSGDDRMLDQGESDLLLQEAVRTVIDEAYLMSGHEMDSLLEDDSKTGSQGDGEEPPWPGFSVDGFNQLSDAYGSDRDDTELIELVINLYRELRAMPDYRDYLQDAISELPLICDSWPNNPHGKILLDNYHLRLDQAVRALPEVEELLDAASGTFVKDQRRNAEYTAMFEVYLQTVLDLNALWQAYEADTIDAQQYWDRIYGLKDTLPELTVPRRGAGKPEVGELLDSFGANIHEVFHCFNGISTPSIKALYRFEDLILFTLDSESIRTQLRMMLPALEQLGGFLLAVDDTYSAIKRREHAMDFGDDAHLALALLRGEAAGSYVREHYRALYIDEYQDTSYLQEAILEALGCPKTFRVGDVKQSIYRFRHAKPEIFLARETRYLEDASGAMLRLSYNFRSTPGILRGVNEVFSRIMHRDISKLDYREDHMLNPPALKVEAEATDALPDVKISLLLEPSDAQPTKQTWEEAERDVIERHSVAAKISPEEAERLYARRMREQHYDPSDTPEHYYVAAEIAKLHTSGIPYSDIAVMARSWNTLAGLEEQLEAMGIPSSQAVKTAAFESYEIKLLVAFLQLLDNARQDIPLVSVLLSPLLGQPFTEEELAQIRIWSKEFNLQATEYHPDWFTPTPFFVAWDAFGKHVIKDDSLLDLQERVRVFQAELKEWRLRERTTSLGDLVQELLQQSQFMNLLADLPDKELRMSRVRSFQVWCERFDSPVKLGVHALITRLEAIETSQLVAPWMEEGQKDNQVKLMTFHGSKGLEFPYVFIIGLEKGYSLDKYQKAVIMDQELGLGYDIRLDGGRIQMKSVLYQALSLKAHDLNLAEELNLLYVAMTRAEKKLWLIGKIRLTKEGLNAKYQRILESRGGKDPDLAAVKTLRSNLDAVLLALADETGMKAMNLSEQLSYPDALDYTGALSDGTITSNSQGSFAWSLIHLKEYQVNLKSALYGEVLGTLQRVGEAETEGPDEMAPRTINKREQLVKEGEWLRSKELRRPYPAQLATRTPLKFTVTELKRRADLEFEESIAETARDESGAPVSGTPEKGSAGMATLLREITREDPFAPLDLTPGDTGLEPELVNISSESGLNARERGIALHSFMQYAPWGELVRDGGDGVFAQTIQKMEEKQILQSNEAHAVSDAIPALRRFAESDLLRNILAAEQAGQGSAVYRELPFTLMLPLQDLFPSYRNEVGEDRCFVQGMMDLWYENDDELVLVDYKSDRILGSDEEVERELARRYSLQLSIYARALRAARGRDVTRSIIWLIPHGRSYIIDHNSI